MRAVIRLDKGAPHHASSTMPNRQHRRYYNFDRAAMYESRDATPTAEFLHALSDAGTR
jgi:hypothetical protein